MAYGLTKKQRAILETILRGGAGPGNLRLQELLDNLPYKTSKDSLQFSLRALEKAKFIRTDKYATFEGRRHRYVSLTEDGFKVMKFLKQGWDLRH